MKLAVLIYGMYREFDSVVKCYDPDINNFFECDYYFSTWNKSKQKYNDDDSYKEFDVTPNMITDYLPNCVYNILDEDTIFPIKPNRDSMNYSGFHWQNLYRMVEESNKEYDLLFLNRSDTAYNIKYKYDTQQYQDWIDIHKNYIFSDEIIIKEGARKGNSYYFFHYGMWFMGTPDIMGKFIKSLPDMKNPNNWWDAHADTAEKLMELDLYPNPSAPIEGDYFRRPFKWQNKKVI